VSANRGPWVVADGSAVHRVTTVLELEAALDDMHERARRQHALATIVSPNGKRLLIGVGGAQSVLQFNQGNEPPYLTTLGASEAEGVETFEFEGQATEIERRHLIPMEGARHAAVIFFETGLKPNSVRWEEV
jgi:hypothetical protein